MGWPSLVGALNDTAFATFGTPVVYQPVAGSPYAITGILNAGIEPDTGNTFFSLEVRPDLMIPGDLQEGAQVVIGADTYAVYRIDPGSPDSGTQTLKLKKRG